MKRKIICLLIYSCFLTTLTLGQTIEDWANKATRLQYTNPDSSIYYFHKAEEVALKVSNREKLHHIYKVLSTLYRWKEKFDLGLLYAEKMLETSNTLVERGFAYCNIGQTYGNLDLEKGDSILQLAEDIAIEVQDSVLLGSVYPNRAALKLVRGDMYSGINYFIKAVPYAHGDLAIVQYYYKIAQTFLSLENYERAEEYILKSIAISEKRNYNMRNCMVAMIYAQVLMKQKNYEIAKEEAEKATQCFAQKKRWNPMVWANSTLTEYFMIHQMWEEAITTNEESLAILDKLSAGDQCIVLNDQSQIFLYQKKYQAVIDNSKRILGIAQNANHTLRQRDAYQMLSQAYAELDQYQLSFDFYKQYQSIEDSLFRNRQTAYVNNLEAEYNRKEQQNEINNQTVQLSQQKRLMTFGGIALLIISGLLTSLFFSSKKIKGQNKVISKALKEKDILLREIHHRVKNNLQLVSSLLGLQSRYVDDPNALEALKAGKSRVKSMSLIHQDLYNRENLTGVSVREYLEKLCRELVTTFQVDTNKVKLQTDIADLILDVDTLVPLGLIINELLTNSLKYAFPDGQDGIIQVRLIEQDEKLLLEVRDNGKGIDSGKKSKTSFGHKLIDTLVGQLEGEMELKSEKGTQVILTFQEYKKVA